MEGSFSFDAGPKILRGTTNGTDEDFKRNSPHKRNSFKNAVRSMSTDVNSPTAQHTNFINISDLKNKETILNDQGKSTLLTNDFKKLSLRLS